MCRLIKIEHYSGQEKRYKVVMDDENSLTLSCPICGAEPGEQCEMNNGSQRFISHVDRWDFVQDGALKGPPLYGLSDSQLPGYLTLTERVLVLLDGYPEIASAD